LAAGCHQQPIIIENNILMIDMMKISFSEKKILVILWIIFFFICPQVEMAEGNPREKMLDVRACNMSDVLTKMCQAKKIKITMNKTNNKKVPCDYQGRGDIYEDIKFLLARENCAVLWNYKANRIASVNILFFEGSSTDAGNGRHDGWGMKNKHQETLTFPPSPMENPDQQENVPMLPPDGGVEVPFPPSP
jgi:hypothetical protein